MMVFYSLGIMKKQYERKYEKAINIFRGKSGILKTGEALNAGIHPRTLYGMEQEGLIEKLGRGLFRLTDLPALSNPDLVSVALQSPNGVVCLISALAFHEITSQIPHEVYIALKRGSEPPRIAYPPVRIFWFSGKAFTEGIEIHDVDGVSVPVYTPEKTIADCFKYRNKIGLDTALEALKLYREKKSKHLDRIIRHARICRVDNVMRPYLESLL